MNKYREWYKEQPEEFRKLITDGFIPDIYVDTNYKEIDLKELEELDNKFC